MADLTSVSTMLKEVWPARLETAFSNEIVALSRIENTSDGVRTDVSGRYTVIPLHVSRNHGIGSRAERAVLPAPGKQGYNSARVDLRHQYGVGDISSQALLLADREPRSFINAIDRELEGLQTDAMKDYARQVYGDGTGTLGTVDGAPAANVITVDRTQYFAVGQVLDAVAPGGPTVTATGMTVTAVDEDAKTVTVDDDTGVADTNVLVRTGNYNQEITGLDALLDSDHATVSFQNLTSASEPTWKPLINSDAAHAYSEVEIIAQCDRVRRNSGKMTSVMFTHFGVRRAIFSALQQDRQFHNTIEFGQGFSALPFSYGAQTIPQVEDPDFPGDFDAASAAIYGLNEDSISVYQEETGWHFSEETGSIFYPSTDRSDTFEYRLRKFSNMGYAQRNCHWKVANVNTAS